MLNHFITRFFNTSNTSATLAAALALGAITHSGQPLHAQDAAPAATKIQLIDGDILTGEVVAEDGTTTTIKHPTLGNITVSNDKIASSAASSADSAESDAQAETAEMVQEIPAEPASLFPGWDSNLAAGVSGSDGNSQTFGMNAKFTTKRETEKNRTAIDAAYFYESDDSSSTKNQATAGILHDWLIPESKWFYWMEGRIDWDQFQSWDYRANVGGGLGYNLIEEDDLSVNLRGGIGFSKEWGSMDDDWKPEGILGADADWKIADNQSLIASTRIYPDLEDGGEFRTRSTVEWKIALDKAKGLNLNFGIVHEYESVVDPGSKKSDLTYYGALSVDF